MKQNKKSLSYISLLLTIAIIYPNSYTNEHPPVVSYSAKDAFGIPLDITLSQLMPYQNGIFFEVGANDGITQSNTKLFESHYNWTGILVEPSPTLFQTLCNNRPNSRCFQCALGSFEEHGNYVYGDFDGSLMSSLTNRLKRPKNINVLIRSMQSILNECRIQHVNFFSLDVEGYELNILKGIDFTKTTFDYILIEIYTHQFEAIVSFLKNKGYSMLRGLSNYSYATNPMWDGTHNDYLFKRDI